MITLTRRARHRIAPARGLASLLVAFAVLLGASESALCRADGAGHLEEQALRSAASAIRGDRAAGTHEHGATQSAAKRAPRGPHDHAIKHANHSELCALPALVASLGAVSAVARPTITGRLTLDGQPFKPVLKHGLLAQPRAPPVSALA